MKFRQFVNEARLTPDEAKYRTTDVKWKETDDKDKISKVIVSIFKQDASAATKLAMSFDDIWADYHRLEEELEEKKELIREKAGDLFDAADEVVTRVIETKSCLISIHKAAEKTTAKLDTEALFSKLLVLQPELEATLKKLIEEFTAVKTTVSKAAVAVQGQEVLNKLRKESVDVNENFVDVFTAAAGRVVSFVKGMFKKIDPILMDIRHMMRSAGIKYTEVK